MVPANKILTVAYGTFSCTLEGFDDPFSTMTDIAEYFRDLAAEDRFFGAEPPTPDMAMLRTIAETRAKQAVTAEPDESGVVLRPSAVPAPAAMDAAFEATDLPTEPALAASLAEAAAADAAGSVEGIVDDTPRAEIDETAEETVAEDAPAEDAPEEPAFEPESAAAKLARIRGVVEADRQSSAIYSEDEHAEDMIAGMVEDDLAAAFAEDADARAETVETVPESDTVEQPEADDTIADVSGEDTLAADLAAILPSMDTDDEAVGTAEAEDVQPVDAAPAGMDDDDAGNEEVAAVEDGFDTEESSDEEQAVDVLADDAAPDGEIGAARPETPEDDVAEDPSDATVEETRAERRQRRIRIRRVRRQEAEAAALTADATSEEVAEETDGMEANDDLMTELAAIEAELDRDPTGSADADDADDDLMAELAAIRAADAEPEAAEDGDGRDDEGERAEAEADAAFEAELAAAMAADLPAEDADAASDAETPVSDDTAIEPLAGEGPAASVADEEHVAAEIDEETTATSDEVAEWEAEIETASSEETSDEETSDEETGEDVIAEDETAEPNRGAVPEAADMERLFAATDSRLSGEDASRRHANISHLKAAVAARRADGPIEEKADTEADAYRADLASTVRPRRTPVSEERRARTPRPERPAPLVLVSEQRVEDTPEPATERVMPRRATRTAEAEIRDEALAGSEDFEAFAADVGAKDLPEILEAAAVYSAKVMGQDNFSRPRLLHLAAEAVDDMSREDGLRGFGQLLRDGTIRKVSRGTFALASESRYSEEADRRAG
ncbi:hypothetical protein [Jannaschia marina]|uniref:hypothetical protein n=1 Tax=Jannaschia marina TaxID=2741674 RepID=UPI0015C78E59|nr:hypothetical protein [Jannaschia marina]